MLYTSEQRGARLVRRGNAQQLLVDDQDRQRTIIHALTTDFPGRFTSNIIITIIIIWSVLRRDCMGAEPVV